MTNDKNNNLWLTFTLRDNLYAIKAQHVGAILRRPPNVTPVPNAAPFVRGLIDINRGDLITMIGLRELFLMPSLESELEEFKQMLNQRKQDHINWVNALEDSVINNTEFKLTTDPHKCAFGKWYYNYETNSHPVRFQMRKIDEPHKLLHETAIEVAKLNEEKDFANKKNEVEKLLRRASKQLMPKVLRLIDGTIDAFEESHREMLVVLHYDGKDNLAIILDEVLKVEPLEIISENENGELIYDNEYINGIAKRQNDETLILTINVAAIISKSNSVLGNQKK